MEECKKDAEFDRLAFTVLAIEATAQKFGISPSEMRRWLDNVGADLIMEQNSTHHCTACRYVAHIYRPSLAALL